MPRRVREISLDGIVVKISPMTWAEAEVYLTETKDLLARPADNKPTETEWTQRMLRSVCSAINTGENRKDDAMLTPDSLIKEFDMPTLQYIQREYLSMSGLVTSTPGGAPATSTSA
jgi:hypothetical protein